MTVETYYLLELMVRTWSSHILPQAARAIAWQHCASNPRHHSVSYTDHGSWTLLSKWLLEKHWDIPTIWWNQSQSFRFMAVWQLMRIWNIIHVWDRDDNVWSVPADGPSRLNSYFIPWRLYLHTIWYSSYRFNDKEVTEWVVSLCDEQFNQRCKGVSSQAWPLNASVILTHFSWKWMIKVLLKE
jgi:hypothetical protein